MRNFWTNARALRMQIAQMRPPRYFWKLKLRGTRMRLYSFGRLAKQDNDLHRHGQHASRLNSVHPCSYECAELFAVQRQRAASGRRCTSRYSWS
eukprot:7773088-Pyramimonas_sp.AAC.1